MTWDEISSPHIGCRCVLKDTRNLRCVDHAVTLVLPREVKAVTVTGPPPYRRPDTSQVASPETIARLKAEALAIVAHAKQRRTTVEEPTEEPA